MNTLDFTDEPVGRADRMRGTRLDTRTTWLARLCRWLSGDWWFLEERHGRYGVWHPWKPHIWGNYVMTLENAEKERDKLNSGMSYRRCSQCGLGVDRHSNAFAEHCTNMLDYNQKDK